MRSGFPELEAVLGPMSVNRRHCLRGVSRPDSFDKILMNSQARAPVAFVHLAVLLRVAAGEEAERALIDRSSHRIRADRRDPSMQLPVRLHEIVPVLRLAHLRQD